MKPWKTIITSAVAVLLAAMCNALLSRLFFLKLQSISWMNTLGGMLLLSAAPALVLFLLSKPAERFFLDGRRITALLPLAFFFAGLLPWTAPLTGTNDTFLWYYQAILASGTFGWSLILCIAEFTVRILQNRPSRREAEKLPQTKQKEKCK